MRQSTYDGDGSQGQKWATQDNPICSWYIVVWAGIDAGLERSRTGSEDVYVRFGSSSGFVLARGCLPDERAARYANNVVRFFAWVILCYGEFPGFLLLYFFVDLCSSFC